MIKTPSAVLTDPLGVLDDRGGKRFAVMFACLSLWERCLRQGAERVKNALPVSFADSSPKGRAEGASVPMLHCLSGKRITGFSGRAVCGLLKVPVLVW